MATSVPVVIAACTVLDILPVAQYRALKALIYVGKGEVDRGQVQLEEARRLQVCEERYKSTISKKSSNGEDKQEIEDQLQCNG